MSRPPRAPSFSYRGRYRYFVTFCCRNRECIFVDADRAVETLAQFRRCARDFGFEILAYCLMPDHVHLLVEGLLDSADLRQFVKMAKQRSGAQFAKREKRPLWQEGYVDRILRQEDDAYAIARYILENPVRGGLVDHAAAYPHVGSDRWTLEQLFDVYNA